MKRLTLLALALAAQTGVASAQMAPSAGAAPVLGPASLEIDHGVVLDTGAPITSTIRDGLSLSWVPRGSAWQVDIPATMTIEGLQTVTVACSAAGFLLGGLGFSGSNVAGEKALIGSVEHVFPVEGPFRGHLIIGVPRIGRSEGNFVRMICRVSARGVRAGIDWRAFEYQSENLSVQYVLEAGDSRLWTGAPFTQQVVLTVIAAGEN